MRPRRAHDVLVSPLAVRVASSSARLPSIRGNRRGGDAPAASMRWTEGASRSVYRTVPAMQSVFGLAARGEDVGRGETVTAAPVD